METTIMAYVGIIGYMGLGLREGRPPCPVVVVNLEDKRT